MTEFAQVTREAAASPRVVAVSHDVAGIRAAALEMFEEAAFQKTVMPGEEESQEKQPQRQLAAGYYKWVQFLLQVMEWMKVKPDMPILGDELRGIAAINSARAEFEEKWPACGACGERVDKFVLQSGMHGNSCSAKKRN